MPCKSIYSSEYCFQTFLICVLPSKEKPFLELYKQVTNHVLIFYVPIFSITLKPPSVQGLFAFCSLGMLHSDLTLTELALKELIPYRDSPEYVSHIAVFKAYTHFLQVRFTITVK
jgi:hypothetical protein